MPKKNIVISLIIYLIIIPLVITLGIIFLDDRKYIIISLIIAFVSCLPFFIKFENNNFGSREVVVMAVMTAISVVGRIIFYPIPGFKPVTAIVVICGIALGSTPGFIIGAFSAIVSNIFFGQGPWTPFQMFIWGIIGFLSGIIFRNKKEPNKILLAIIGILGGVLFSLTMDIWTTIALDEVFTFKRYLFHVATSLPFMAIYAVSNVIFLLVLTNPILKKLNRIKDKYEIFSN